MPFVNDMLDSVERGRADKEALAAENQAPGDTTAAVPGTALQSRYRFDVDTVMAVVRHEVRGQPEALDAIENMLRVVRADIADPRRPPFTALFLGPTGVGKTETVRALARGLHGDADAFCRVDMNTLSQEHYAAALTGAPPGYVGAKEGKTLLDQEVMEGSLGKPGIVLFDELEKASPQVTQALLNVFDNGELTVASGERTYSFRNTLVFMTSNLGAREIQRQDAPGGWRALLPRSQANRSKRLNRLLRDKLNGHFSPEFVNRIDNVTVFNWIERELLEELIELEVERLNRRLDKHGCRLVLGDRCRRWLADAGFDRQYGARALRRTVRQQVEVPFAAFLLEAFDPDSASPEAKATFDVDLRNGKAAFVRRDG
ncbi:AAA family ATPase [Aquisalimonas asiatica]|uniref:C-terminal, D2-small domain-containing protein, of ClpB protein n=1 Tax=Aquisalimonas asiatica TaxID=406100 RepID=A0A1H8V1W8_9GAMM|nr:AAA family ATPase [Aquisalimonas asiatica]SEP08758.1 C-terminal, D2-small domain-containing protein, of ClpB protein [Aquisalimonas asiatica]